MSAEVVQLRGLTFMGRTNSGHWIPLDGPADFRGSDSAPRPKELILIGLGGCTAADVASILNKMRENITNFKVDIDAEMANEHPKVYTKIHLTYMFWGEGLKEENLKKAIELSQEKYCSVTAMLKNAVEITYSYEINPVQES